MKQKKPDRFERIARKSIIRLGHEDEDIARLLRREHAAVVRLVKSYLDARPEIAANPDWERGFDRACLLILDQLKRRKG